MKTLNKGDKIKYNSEWPHLKRGNFYIVETVVFSEAMNRTYVFIKGNPCSWPLDSFIIE